MDFALFSRIAALLDRKRPRGGLWISIAAIAAAACIFVGLRTHGGRSFGVVIDGGSTGSRIHVFAYWARRGAVPMIDLRSTATMKVVPGLSAYAENPEEAGESLQELLEFARGRVPRDEWGRTEVRLMATAGMRLVDVAVQERILESCRSALRGSGFSFRSEWAKVITGLDEGIYAWVTANHALGSLGNDPQHTTGVIELGGASMQITFVSNDLLPYNLAHVLQLGRVRYKLYSYSFLHFGQNVALESIRLLLSSGELQPPGNVSQKGLILDPCSPKGYIPASHSQRVHADVSLNLHATGNFSECRTVALSLLQKGKDNCSYKHCSIGSVYVPKLQGNFLATENFFYTSKFLGLSPTAPLTDMVTAGEEFCRTDWPKLRQNYPMLPEENLVQYCFSSAYIVAMLHDCLGITMDEKRIRSANQVGSIPLDWAMGAFLMQRMSADAENQPGSDWTVDTANNDTLTLLVIVGIVLVSAMAAWFASRWIKPRLKMAWRMDGISVL